MAGADKQAKLLSDLLAAKGGATGDAARSTELAQTSVIQIAKRRPSDDRASEAPAAPSVLYSKGAATASTFRPSYWSFDHEEQVEPKVAPAKAEATSPPASVAPTARAPRSRPLPINFVVAFGCVALFLSTTLFVLSQQHRIEAPAASPTPSTVAAASAPAAPVVPLPPTPPAESVAVAPAPTPVASAPAPAPATVAPTPMPAVSEPPSAAVAPTPTPVISEPPAVVSEPPPSALTSSAPAEPASKAPAPAPVVASTPTSGPAPSADPKHADALLARGDDLLATGDVAAARLFYQRAAELGSAAAATAVGQTYDPGVLELLRVRGARGDVQMATEWYRKAIAAGDRQAEIRLKRLLARTPG